MSEKGVGQKRLFQVIPKDSSESDSGKNNEESRSEKEDKQDAKRLKLDSSRSDDSNEHPLKHMFDEPDAQPPQQEMVRSEPENVAPDDTVDMSAFIKSLHDEPWTGFKKNDNLTISQLQLKHKTV